MRYVLALLPLVCGCSMPHGAAMNFSTQDEPTSEATWQRVLDVPVLKIVGEFCDEVIYEDDEYRDCRLVNTIARGRLSGTPCGDHIRTADHRFEMDLLYVDGAEVPAPPPHTWRHEHDDVLFIDHVCGKDARCQEYVPPVGAKVWAVGYPAGDDVDGVNSDHREKVVIEGVVVNDGEFHPDVIHIELRGHLGRGMSGGPVVAEVDGSMVAFATIAGYGECVIEATSWLHWFPPVKGMALRATLCRPRGAAYVGWAPPDAERMPMLRRVKPALRG